MTEKVLDYDRNFVKQERYWTCGPATTQNILSARGIFKDELILRDEIEALEGNVGWDDQDGTDNISQVATVLNRYLDGGFVVRGMPNDPPTVAQQDLLWQDVVRSVDAGFGVAANIMVPSSNFPRGTRGSVSPAYSGRMVYHYLAIMGYADEGNGRHVWVADSGFSPYGYWCSLEQMASMISGKGYAAKPVVPAPKLSLADIELTKLFASRSKYRDSDALVDTLAGFILNIDARLHEASVEAQNGR